MSETELDQPARTSGKSPAAFRTISEVSTELNVPQHVLRFWETKFTQLRPLKRGGGRRYYRPQDVELLRRIHRLLYAEGYTIKGVQRLLRGAKGGADQDDAATRELHASDDEDEASGSAAMLVPDVDAHSVGDEHESGGAGLRPTQREELAAILDELRELRRMLRE